MPTYEPEDIVGELRKGAAALGGRRIAAVVVGAVLLILLFSTWFTVQPEETGIVLRFGAVSRTAGPGLHFTFPAGIESVRLVPTARVLKEEFEFGTALSAAGGRTQYVADTKAFKDVSLMLTGDLNVIDVQWIVQYRIGQPPPSWGKTCRAGSPRGSLIDRRSGSDSEARHPVDRLGLPASRALQVSYGPSAGQRRRQSARGHRSPLATATPPRGSVKSEVAQ